MDVIVQAAATLSGTTVGPMGCPHLTWVDTVMQIDLDPDVRHRPGSGCAEGGGQPVRKCVCGY